jgi:hypothetical protein
MKSASPLRIQLPYLLAVALFPFLLTACGGRMLNKNMAQNLIANLPGDLLKQEDFVVEGVSQTNASNAVIRTKINAAFRFQKVDGKWIPREVRLGNDQWESVDDLVKALRKVKEDKTKVFLDTVSEAIEKYCRKNGELPGFNDYDSLSDPLAPEYLDPLIRLDAWERQLHAVRLGSNSVKLISAGADGKLGSNDDIEVTSTCTGK